jgi:CDP-diacylglycerol--glycerol-3-phosphate 3-phosphatidyltransferase
MKNKVITIPNIISISRLILAWPIAYSIYHEQLIASSLFGLIAVLSDFLDGYLSRKLDQASDAGKVIDPIVDCILVLAVMVALYIKSLIPVWYIKLIIIRYLLIFVLLSIYKFFSKQTPKSILTGKISMCSIAIVIVTAVFQQAIPAIFTLSLLVSTSLLILSFADYARTYR